MLSLVFVVASPCLVRAAGPWPLGRGASSLGRGGTSLADPHDPTAIYLNPAALPNIAGLQLMADGNMAFDYGAISRTPDDLNQDGTATEYDRIDNAWSGGGPSPGYFAAYNLKSAGLEKLTVGAGVFGPLRVYHEWPKDGPQRYGEVDDHNVQVQYTLGAGYELPWYRLRIGAAAMLIGQSLDTTVTLNTFLSLPENKDYDASVHVKTSSDYVPTAVLGISGAPFPFLIVSAAYQLPYDVATQGKAGLVLGRQIDSVADVSGEDLTVEFQMPGVLNLAALYRHPSQRFELELAYQWEGWGRQDAAILKPKDIHISVPSFSIERDLPELTIDLHWRNTYSLRFGGEVVVVPELLTLRAGTFYERGAAPRRRLSAAVFDLDKIGVTAGARIDLPWVEWLVRQHAWLDLAGSYSGWRERTVHRSEVRIFNPLSDPPEPEWPVGNGLYENHQILVMAALGLAFDI